MRHPKRVVIWSVVGLACLRPAFGATARTGGVEAALNQRGEQIASVATGQESGSSPAQGAAKSLLQLRREVLSGEAASTAASSKSLCAPSSTHLCLLGRFVVIADWDNPFFDPNAIFDAGARQLTTESGYMWFDDPLNMEIPIKILDFCDVGTFKVFAAGLTNFGVGIGILDLVSGIQKNYINPDRRIFDTIIDNNPPWPCP